MSPWIPFFGEFASVVGVSIVVGAGIPALYALGIRLLAYGSGAHDGRRRPVGLAASYLVFAVVVATVLLGIAIVVAAGLGVTI